MFKQFLCENYKEQVIKLTINCINDFAPIKHAFFFGKNGEKVYLKKPNTYRDYEVLVKSEKKKMFNELYKYDDNFRIYFEGIRTFNKENLSNFRHLKECILLCDKFGDKYEKECRMFINMANAHSNHTPERISA